MAFGPLYSLDAIGALGVVLRVPVPSKTKKGETMEEHGVFLAFLWFMLALLIGLVLLKERQD